MVVELIAAGGIVAGAVATIMFGVRKWIRDERARREEDERRREEAAKEREDRVMAAMQAREDRIMAAMQARDDRVMARLDSLSAEFEKLRQQRAADREEDERRRAADREEDLKRWAELMAEIKVIANRVGAVEKKVGDLCVVVEELGKRVTALESDFAAFREFVMPLMMPAGSPQGGAGHGSRGRPQAP